MRCRPTVWRVSSSTNDSRAVRSSQVQWLTVPVSCDAPKVQCRHLREFFIIEVVARVHRRAERSTMSCNVERNGESHDDSDDREQWGGVAERHLESCRQI